ncbi:MAG: putative Fe/S biosis protein NfuA [Actinomycetota bacterium]
MTTPPSPFAGTDSPTSPFAEGGLTADNLIVEITEAANVKLKELRDLEPETDRLGLRVEIVSGPGEDFRYDLSFEIVTQAAFTDEVRTVDGLKIIVPANSIDLLSGSILDYNDTQGLIIRNPNKPLAAAVEGLIADDALASSIQDILSSEVNPALAAHGGFVSFVGHDGEGVAYLTMGGGCHGCSMSRMTMLEGVQTTLIEKVPGVVKVRDLTDHTSGENPYYT